MTWPFERLLYDMCLTISSIAIFLTLTAMGYNYYQLASAMGESE